MSDTKHNLLLYLSGVTIYVLILKCIRKSNNDKSDDSVNIKTTRNLDKSRYIASTYKLQTEIEIEEIEETSLKSPPQKRNEQSFVGLTPISNSIIATQPIIKKLGYSNDEVIIIGIAGGILIILTSYTYTYTYYYY